jgi:hypothetical protein
MHAFFRVVAWLVVMLLIAAIHYQIPRSESAFRAVLTLTFMLWLVVGALYGLRGVFRFFMAQGK